LARLSSPENEGGAETSLKGNRMWKRKKKKLLGFDVVFDEGGKTYVYQKTAEEMEQIIRDRYVLRGEVPYSVEAIYSDGHREKITFSDK